MLNAKVMFAGEMDGVASKVAVKVPVWEGVALLTKPLLLVMVLPLATLDEELDVELDVELEELLLREEALEDDDEPPASRYTRT